MTLKPYIILKGSAVKTKDLKSEMAEDGIHN